MTDKLFDLDRIRDPSGDADMERSREIFAKMLRQGNLPEGVDGLLRDCLEETKGIVCGRCGKTIPRYFYLEVVSEEPRKEMMVCETCYRPDQPCIPEEPDGQ